MKCALSEAAAWQWLGTPRAQRDGAIAEHTARCPRCRAQLEHCRQAREQLRLLAEVEPLPVDALQAWSQIQARMGARRSTGWRRATRLWCDLWICRRRLALTWLALALGGLALLSAAGARLAGLF